MAEININTRIQQGCFAAADLTAANPVLLRDEMIYERETNKCKRGDGVSTWRQLPYLPEAKQGEPGKPGVNGINANVAFTENISGWTGTAGIKVNSVTTKIPFLSPKANKTMMFAFRIQSLSMPVLVPIGPGTRQTHHRTLSYVSGTSKDADFDIKLLVSLSSFTVDIVTDGNCPAGLILSQILIQR